MYVWVSLSHVYVCVHCVSVQMYMCMCQQQTRTSEHFLQTSSYMRLHESTWIYIQYVAVWLIIIITLIDTVSDGSCTFVMYIGMGYTYLYLNIHITQFLSVSSFKGFSSGVAPLLCFFRKSTTAVWPWWPWLPLWHRMVPLGSLWWSSSPRVTWNLTESTILRWETCWILTWQTQS